MLPAREHERLGRHRSATRSRARTVEGVLIGSDSAVTIGDEKKLDTRADMHKSAPWWMVEELCPPAMIASTDAVIVIA